MKRMLKKILLLVSSILFLSANVYALSIDFHGFAAGTIIDNEYLPDFSVLATANGDPRNRAMIFNTQNPTGGDWDLGSPFNDGNAPGSYGNALIISEDLDSSDPDDNARGGVITFSFPNYNLSSFGLHLLDIDNRSQNEQFGHIDFFNNGGFIESYLFSELIALSDFGDRTANKVDPINPGEDFNKVEIHLVSSGAVDNIVANPVPEPGTMLLLGSGLIGLAGFGRKKFFKK